MKNIHKREGEKRKEEGGRGGENLQWEQRSELWQLIFTMAYKRNGVHKFQVTLHQPQKAKEEQEARETGRGRVEQALHCLPECVCVSSVAQQTLN